MLLFGKNEATWPPEGPQSNIVIKSLDSWMQSIWPLREASASHYNGHQKGSTEVARGNQASDQAAKRTALQNNDLIEVATLVPQTNLPEVPSYTEGETLKAKGWGRSRRSYGVVPKGGTPFSAWEPPMEVG